MTEEQSAMMLQLQKLSLTMIDLGEYLDTHPMDDFAIKRYDATAEAYSELMCEYSVAYGPLMQMNGNNGKTEWQWAAQDFPWAFSK